MHNIKEMIKEAPKHNAIIYVNRHSLSEEFYRLAGEAIEDDNHLYIVFSNTGSPTGETIARITRKEYSHVSLSFDKKLNTIVSYNGGNNIFAPGMNQELIQFLMQKEDAKIGIYRIKASRKQQLKILRTIREIDNKGSSYNVLGLLIPYSARKNTMVCAHFVYKMLEIAGLKYFEKRPEKVRPMDFLEYDHENRNRLEFCREIFTRKH